MKLGFRAGPGTLTLVTVEITCKLRQPGTANQVVIDPTYWQIVSVSAVDFGLVYKIDQEPPKR